MTYLFECPYCHRHTADPVEGWLEDENDPDTEETRWYCSTCQAEWWAYGHDKPQAEKVLIISPRYPERKPMPIETYAARYLFRRQFFYDVRDRIDFLNHGETRDRKPLSEIIAKVKNFEIATRYHPFRNTEVYYIEVSPIPVRHDCVKELS